MSRSAYPTAMDLNTFLQGTNFPHPADTSYPDVMAYTVAQWESNVGWYPYLSTGVSEVRLFDPPCNASGFGHASSHQGGRTLDLGGGLLSVDAGGLSIGYVPTAGNAKVGSVLTQGVNYYLRPNNAVQKGQSFTSIEFLSPVRGLPQSIRISGVFGRALTLSDDTWLAILYKAVSVMTLRFNISLGAIASIRTEDTQTQFVDMRTRLTNADTIFTQQVQNERRLVL